MRVAKIKESKLDNVFNSDNVFNLLNLFLTILVVISILYPLYFIIIASVSDPYAVNSGMLWLFPINPTLEGYVRIFRDESIVRGYMNTIIYTVVGTSINIALNTLAAYPLSRKDFFGRKFFTIMITITMFFHGGMIPLYLVVKSLGLIDTMWALVLPGAVTVINIIIMRTNFQSVPDELRQASEIDGCGSIRYLFYILLPVSKAIIAVIVLFYAVNHWNDFFAAMIYISNPKKYPLQLVLRDILILSKMSEGMMDDAASLIEQQRVAEVIKYGIIVVGAIPMIIFYMFIQKYFIKGIMIGAVKG